MPQPLNIAIIGAGPAGCTLAHLLHRNLPEGSAKLEVFERETALHDRDQGGTLDLHDETGLAALRAAGLIDTPEFDAVARRDGDAIVLCDKQMRRWLNIASTADGGWFAQGKPEIDRMALRKLLLESLPREMITWGKQVVKVVNSPHDATSVLHFRDGSTSSTRYDLVVGADGTYSVVRPLLTPLQPFFSGVGGWNMLCKQSEAARPLLTKMVNRGSLFAYSDGKVLMGQQLGSGDLYISMWGVKPEAWMDPAVAGYDVADPKQVKAALLEEFSSWAPELRELIASFDEARVWPRSLVMLPTGIRWDSRPGVTVLGDAAHVMCPFAGLGVNAAMGDAMGLADEIALAVKQGATTAAGLGQCLGRYEAGMFGRAHAAQRFTVDIMKLMLFTPGAPCAVIEDYILRVTADDMGANLASAWGF
ncbi:FAD/NAD(P)-binding domain-containing protein [Apiospora aurea]|uniref:FAD/NAD(P)-binding domain-containing protein n=1 Tax=Apiospora aurea TaxID=335848 RepID=A0ABR1QL00_9PEZI